MINDARKARLFGGDHDGMTATVDTRLLIVGLELPARQPPYADTFMLERYRFDGTVNEQGEYRFRVES